MHWSRGSIANPTTPASVMKTLFSLIESPFRPDFSAFIRSGIAAERFDTARNLHRALQKQPPDFFVGEFIYGWGNNYAGANVSNLDASGPCNALRRRRRSSCSCIPVTYPVSEQTMQAALQTPA
jgi:hypothetical protein